MSTFNFSSDKKAQPTIISSIFSILFSLAMFTIFMMSLFNVIGLSIVHFLPNVVFPASIQPYLTELFTWGTWMNVGISVGIAIIWSIIYYFKKDKRTLSEKIAAKIVALFLKKNKASILETVSFASKVTAVQNFLVIIPGIFNFMVSLHAFGLVFGIEQQPFVKGLFSFGSFANIFWPSLIVFIVFIINTKNLLLLGLLASPSERAAAREEKRKLKEQQKQEAAEKAIADTEQRILDRFAEFGFDADYKFKYFSVAQKKECEGTVSLFASLVAKYPRPYGTSADYLRLIMAQETPEKLLEFATLYLAGKDEDFARWGIKTNY